MRPTFLLVALSLSLHISCGRTLSTQELLNADFFLKGLAAIDLLSPTQDAQVATANPSFTWSYRGFGYYLIQVATDSGFTNIVISKEVSRTDYTVADADLIGITSLASGTYYWRVKASRVADSLQSKTGSFFLLAIPASGSGSAGTMYVNGATTASVQNGGKTAPFKKIQDAISSANVLRNGNKNISINLAVAKGTYSELISLAAGVSIFGGYDSTDWSRNISGNVTTISAPQTTAMTADSAITTAYTATTVVDGFTINGGAVAGSNIINYGIYLTGAPTISNNTISGGSGSVASQYTYGIFVSNANPTIMNNSIHGGTITSTGSAYGIYCTAASPTISYNLITGGNVASTFAHGIYNNSSSNPTITQNVIYAGSGGGSYGIYNIGTSSPAITSNTINGGTAGAASAVAIYNSTSTPSVSNNILFTAAGTFRFSYLENDTASNPTALSSNLFFSATTALYQDCTAGAASCTTTVYLLDQNCGNSALDFGTGAACSAGGTVNPTGGVGAGSNNRASNGTTATIFSASYSLTNLKTWTILGAGPADLDASGGWSTGDIGADASKAGPQ